MKITAIYGSPREEGNTDLLLKGLVRGIREAGTEVTEIYLRKYRFSHCIECGGCMDSGSCVLKDDMDKIYPHLKTAQVIVLSAPVFFYNVSALTKAMIDRCQCFWAAKYLLHEPLSKVRGYKGKGILLSVGGSKGKKTFDGVLLTVRYFFDALDMDFSHYLLYNPIDEKGMICRHATAIQEAYDMGSAIVKQ